MNHDEVRRLEAAVRTANPVPHAFDLVDTKEAAAVTLLVEQRRRATAHTPTQTAPQAPQGMAPPPRRRRSMAWAFTAGIVVTLLVVGAVLLFQRSADSPAADEPATVTTPVDAAPPIGGELLTLSGLPDGVAAVAWSPDGTHLAAAGRAIEGSDGMANVYDAATGDEQLSFSLGSFETVMVHMAYSPDGTRIAVGGPANAVYDAATGDELLGHLADGVLAYSPDGTRLVVGGAWGAAAVLDAATGDEQLIFPSAPSWVWAAAFSPDGNRIATTWGTAVKVWDATSGDDLLTLDSFAPHNVRDVAWSPDGNRIATTRGTVVKVWDATSGDELATLAGHAGDESLTLLNLTYGVQAVAWSPDGTRIATAGDDGTATIWDADSGDELASLTGHTAEVTDVAWSPDGAHVATAGDDGTVKIWNVD